MPHLLKPPLSKGGCREATGGILLLHHRPRPALTLSPLTHTQKNRKCCCRCVKKTIRWIVFSIRPQELCSEDGTHLKRFFHKKSTPPEESAVGHSRGRLSRAIFSPHNKTRQQTEEDVCCLVFRPTLRRKRRFEHRGAGRRGRCGVAVHPAAEEAQADEPIAVLSSLHLRKCLCTEEGFDRVLSELCRSTGFSGWGPKGMPAFWAHEEGEESCPAGANRGSGIRYPVAFKSKTRMPNDIRENAQAIKKPFICVRQTGYHAAL